MTSRHPRTRRPDRSLYHDQFLRQPEHLPDPAAIVRRGDRVVRGRSWAQLLLGRRRAALDQRALLLHALARLYFETPSSSRRSSSRRTSSPPCTSSRRPSRPRHQAGPEDITRTSQRPREPPAQPGRKRHRPHRAAVKPATSWWQVAPRRNPAQPEEKLLKPSSGKSPGREDAPSTAPRRRGTIIDVRIFSRRGSEKGVRAKVIEKEEIARMKRTSRRDLHLETDAGGRPRPCSRRRPGEGIQERETVLPKARS